jgi:hypothetical protein
VLTSAEFSSDSGNCSGAEDSLFCYVLYPNEDASAAGTCRVTRIEIAKAEGTACRAVPLCSVHSCGVMHTTVAGYISADTCVFCTSLQGSTRAQVTQRPR